MCVGHPAIDASSLKGHLVWIEGSEEDASFTSDQVARLRCVFDLYRLPCGAEISKEDLCEIIRHLGHVVKDEAQVSRIAAESTQDPWAVPCTGSQAVGSGYSCSGAFMDFDDFIGFMRRYLSYECQLFRGLFHAYDCDGSGTISAQEVRPLLSQVGMVPMSAMIHEVLTDVIGSADGCLDFSQLTRFLTLYQSSEGFTRAQAADFKRTFSRFTGLDNLMPLSSLGAALAHAMGMEVAAEAIVEKIAGDFCLRAGRSQAEDQSVAVSSCLLFSDFLICARRVREAQLDAYRCEFARYDSDGNGQVSMDEIYIALRRLGHIPLKALIFELAEEVKDGANVDAATEFNFDDFFNFLERLRECSGFRRVELEALRARFDRFDEDGSGEINVLELVAGLRCLGYTSENIDVAQSIIAHVDADGSGSLDFREFLRFERAHRNKELARIEVAFNTFASVGQSSTATLSVDCIDAALIAAGGSAGSVGVDNAVDFDRFVELVDEERAKSLSNRQWMAGFSDEEVDHFRLVFRMYDKDASGDIDARELEALLRDVNLMPHTSEEQTRVLELLSKARADARATGEAAESLNERELKGCVGFPELLQLLRGIRKEKDGAELEYIRQVAEAARFSQREVEQFREVFIASTRRETIFHDETIPDNAPKESAGVVGSLTFDDIRHILHGLGLKITQAQREELKEKFERLDAEQQRQLGFAEFLLLMRWMMDNDFAGIRKLIGDDAPQPVPAEQPVQEDKSGSRRATAESNSEEIAQCLTESQRRQLPETDEPLSRSITPRSVQREPSGHSGVDILEQVFAAFCDMTGSMDSRCFVKVCHDYRLADSCAADVVFTKLFAGQDRRLKEVMGNARRLDRRSFRTALEILAKQAGIMFDDILLKLRSSPKRSSRKCTQTSYVRLNDDTGAYTESYVMKRPSSKHGEEHGNGVGQVPQLVKSHQCASASSLPRLSDCKMQGLRTDASALSGSPSRALLRSRSALRTATVDQDVNDSSARPVVKRSGSGWEMDLAGTKRLLGEVFAKYSAGSPTMTRLDFQRLCQDALLVGGKLSDAAVGTAYSSVAPLGQKSIEFEQFRMALRHVANKKGVSENTVLHAVSLCAGPAFGRKRGTDCVRMGRRLSA